MTATQPAPPRTTTATATILVVEDDPGIAELERSRLDEAGYRVLLAETADDALREVAGGGIDLVLLDYRLPGGTDGLDLYARVKAAGHDLPVILVTGFGNEATVIRALRIGVRDFVTKSLEYLDYLPEAVDRVLRQVGTERRLAESEARLTGIIESASDAVIVVEEDRRVSLFNPAAERMFGCPAAAAHGRPLAEFIPADDPTDGGAEAVAVTLRLRVGRIGVRADGTPFPLDATVSPGQASGRKFHTVVARDVTERHQAEEALRRSEKLLRRAEGLAHVAGWTFDVARAVYATSDEGRRIYGFETATHPADEWIGRVHPDDRLGVDAAIREALAGNRFEIEHRLVVGDRLKWVSVRAEPHTDADGRVACLIGVTQDITDRHQLETQLRHSQKMEAVGQLAGGVAHDFNNLLTVINGYCDLLLEELTPGSSARESVAEILRAGERSAALTRQLLAFSRKAVVTPLVLDLNAVVTGTQKLLRPLIGENVRLTTSLAPDLGAVRADLGQIEQVLVNLAVNARDAMPTGGRLTIETRNVVLEAGDARSHPDAQAGPHVLLAVADTGVGMSADVMARIFEPFFTTKGPGQGTGLGLATVYGIVKQSGGHVTVESVAGGGTTFKVYLPRAERETDGPTVRKAAASPNRGTETVLLVEDDEAVRTLTGQILTTFGYTVHEAADGVEAARLADGLVGRLHLLITDVVMPGAGGREVAERVTQRHPAAKVLFVSGYTDDAVVRQGVLHQGVHFLQKPYSASVLAAKVRAVLDGAEHPGGANR